MDGGEDWLYRPVLRGIVPLLALDDTAYDLGQFVELNEAMDVEAENHARVRKWAERKT